MRERKSERMRGGLRETMSERVRERVRESVRVRETCVGQHCTTQSRYTSFVTQQWEEEEEKEEGSTS